SARGVTSAVGAKWWVFAGGTGLVPRRLRENIDPARRLFASDISKAMVDYARNKLIHYVGIEWCEADAGRLPFGAGDFSAVVCAFGVVFVSCSCRTTAQYSGRSVGCSIGVECSCSMSGIVSRKIPRRQST